MAEDEPVCSSDDELEELRCNFQGRLGTFRQKVDSVPIVERLEFAPVRPEDLQNSYFDENKDVYQNGTNEAAGHPDPSPETTPLDHRSTSPFETLTAQKSLRHDLLNPPRTADIPLFSDTIRFPVTFILKLFCNAIPTFFNEGTLFHLPSAAGGSLIYGRKFLILNGEAQPWLPSRPGADGEMSCTGSPGTEIELGHGGGVWKGIPLFVRRSAWAGGWASGDEVVYFGKYCLLPPVLEECIHGHGKDETMAGLDEMKARNSSNAIAQKGDYSLVVNERGRQRLQFTAYDRELYDLMRVEHEEYRAVEGAKQGFDLMDRTP